MIDVSKWFENSGRLSPLSLSLWEWVFVIVGLSLSIWLIFWLRSYYREDADGTDGSLEMLTQFRNLHQEGGLSDDEFRLIRSRLSKSVPVAPAADQTRKGADFASVETRKLQDSAKGTESQIPDAGSFAGDDVKSERMTDEKME